MISVAGSEVGGHSKKGLKELLTLLVVPAAYTYTPLDDLQEKVRILSAPLSVGTGVPLWPKGHLTVNRHGDCTTLRSHIRCNPKMSIDFMRLGKFPN